MRFPRLTLLVILVDYHPRWNWLLDAAFKRLVQEFDKLCVAFNESKTRIVDLAVAGESFDFVGFNFRVRDVSDFRSGLVIQPKKSARKNLLQKLSAIFRSLRSQPIEWVINKINPILRGWINYFRVGNVSRCFSYVKWWVDRKVRRHFMRARLRRGFGWKRWSSDLIYRDLGLFDDYGVRYIHS